MNKKNLNPGLGLCLAALAFGAAAETPAPSEGTVTVDIKSQPVGSALNELAQQSGMQVIFYSDVADGIQAQAVAGTVTPDAALKRLLMNTGLIYEYVNERTVAVQAGAASLGSKLGAGVATTSLIRLSSLQSNAQQDLETRRGTETMGVRQNADPKRRDVEEVIVTAQKRQERLIDVPQSVTVLSTDILAKTGAVQFRDFASTVPGLSFTTEGAGFTQVSLRGVTTGYEVSSTVGIYVDEVPYGSSSAFANGARLTLDAGLFDMDRIEVLRGPQGTLWGASTMGGLIKYVSKQPDSARFGLDVQGSTSSTQHGSVSYNAALAVNAPLVSERAAVRGSAYYSSDGGYVDNLARNENDVNGSGIYGGRIDLSLTPNEALTVRIGGFLQNISRDGNATSDYTFAGVPIDGDLEQSRQYAEPFDQRFRLGSGTVIYDLGSTVLTSISSYQSIRSESTYDTSLAFVPLLTSFGFPLSATALENHYATDKFTQEIRIASEGDRKVEWVLGGFYMHETSEIGQDFIARDVAGLPVPNTFLSTSLPSTYEEYAAFGDLTWNLTAKLSVTGGMRYSEDHLSFEQIRSGILVGGSTPTRRSSESIVTYLGNARYKFNDHATAYARYATGYRPGGPNFALRDPTTGLPIGPEMFESDQLKSYELGLKAATEGGAFGFDLAGYYIDWDDIQIVISRAGFSGRTNAPGGARITGGELSLIARPTSSLVLTGAFAYQDAQMAEANRDLRARKGERLPNVPRFTAAVNADFELPFDSIRPVLGATVRYVGDRTASFDAATGFLQYHLPEYTTVDLRAGFTISRVDLQFYVRNIADEHGQLSASTQYGPAAARVSILQPRTVGITATTHF